MPLVAHPVRSLWGSQPRCARCVCEWLHRKWDGAISTRKDLAKIYHCENLLVIFSNFKYCRINSGEMGLVRDVDVSLCDSSTHFFSPLERIRFRTTRCVLLQGGASPTRTVSLSPVDLLSLSSSSCWPTPSFDGTSAGDNGALHPVFRLEASSIGS